MGGNSCWYSGKTGRPAVIIVFTVLHAEEKFGGGGYKVSGGLHGEFISSKRSSTQLDVHVHKMVRFITKNTVVVMLLLILRWLEDTDKTGTTVRFTPDPEIFTETTTFDFEN